MITKQDIIGFFNAEAEVNYAKHEALMQLPVRERVRQRKAIAGLQLDPVWRGRSPEGELLLLLHADVNWSDFKEGDNLLLHEEEGNGSLKCTLYEFTEEDDLIVSAYSRDASENLLGRLAGKPLLLDKAYVDLRNIIQEPFYQVLPDDGAFWRNSLLNAPAAPGFSGLEEQDAALQQTEKSLGLHFTPRQRESVLRCMATDDHYLIQGPPGTGKSFVLSVIILEELLHSGRKVAVVGPNHLAINNTLLAAVKLFPELKKRTLKIGQLYHARNMEVSSGGATHRVTCVSRANVEQLNAYEGPLLYGFTPYALYTRRAAGLEFDTLVIDEAGQMTVPAALMALVKARKVILAGDHLQLPPIIVSSKIPERLTRSVFETLLSEGNHTMLDVSYRMRGPVCRFVSELFYGGTLQAQTEQAGTQVTDAGELLSFAVPVAICNVPDNGQQVSGKEADKIVEIVEGYADLGLEPGEIAVLSPFRAQAALIRRRLKKSGKIPEEAKGLVAVDTVDKMQGQEREVVIVSLVAGDFKYMNEMGEFLYQPNKLNVAFSRAKSKLIIVCNAAQLKRLDPVLYPHIARMFSCGLAAEV